MNNYNDSKLLTSIMILSVSVMTISGFIFSSLIIGMKLFEQGMSTFEFIFTMSLCWLMCIPLFHIFENKFNIDPCIFNCGV